MILTLIVPGEGGRTSTVAKAGAPVSPALISPPSPLERRRALGFSILLGALRGVNLSGFAVDTSCGNDSVVAGIFGNTMNNLESIYDTSQVPEYQTSCQL